MASEASADGLKLVLMFVVIATLTAGAVVLAGGGDAFWLCLPGALLLAATAPNPPQAWLRAATVVLLAALPPLFDSDLDPLPNGLLVILIPAATVAVLLSMRARLERERDAMRRSALSDPLTGIANRRSLQERIGYEISRHARMRHSFALVMIDLDGFKALNDRFGHGAGDELLREAAAALKHTVRAQDTAARIGGDEFCILAPETDQDGSTPLEARIRRAVGSVTSGIQALSASAGTAIFPADGTSADVLMAAADERLLADKRGRHGGSGYRIAA